MVGGCSRINVVGPESMLFGIWKVLMRSGADAFKNNLHLEAPEAITTSGGYSRGQAVTGDEESDAGQEVVWFKGIWFYGGPHCYNLGIGSGVKW